MMFHAVMLPTIRRVAATRSSPNTQQRTVRMVGNFVALSIVGSVTANRQFISTATFCEGNDKNGGGGIFDAILPKKSDGTIDWDKAKGLISLDQIGKLSGSQLQNAIDSGIPTQLSYGFISGYCSGFALKRVGKVVAVVLGLGFMSIQTLSYYGYVKVDHAAISKNVNNALDLNDDGKMDMKDGEIVYAKIMKVLQFNLPAGSGYVAGFIGGLRSG